MSHKKKMRGEEKPSETKEWTVMFYFASDNPLAPSIVSQLKAIKEAGFHPDVNVIARFDPHGSVTPTHIFDVNGFAKRWAGGRSRIGPPKEDPFVRNLVIDRLGDSSAEPGGHTAEDDGSGDKGLEPKISSVKEPSPAEALGDFLEFCRSKYRARHYILFILGHGLIVGNDLFLYDENTFSEKTRDGDARSESALLLTKLCEILNKFTGFIKEEGGALELLGFHSCSMSSLEVAYQLQKSARYMLASQGPAFVGSWPYRQILMRLFKNLNAELTSADFKPEQMESLFADLNEMDAELFSGLPSADAGASRSRGGNGDGTETEPSRLLAQGLNKNWLNDCRLYEAEYFQHRKFDEARKRVEKVFQENKELTPGDVRRFNRLFLAEVFPDAIEKHASVDTRKMFSDIFHYCLYNSLDFRLAGYPFDITLCDLSKVGVLAEPLGRLTDVLIAGLNSSDKTIRHFILLAHWEAQSYWQENYTDLYDFCLLLYLKCREAAPSSETMKKTVKELKLACYEMMKALSKDNVVGEARDGDTGDPDLQEVKPGSDYGEAIVRSRFTGAAYQYSHGLSIFFPWSEPVANRMWDEQYERYLLNKDMKGKGEQRASWKDFLKKYFDTTLRPTRGAEDEAMARRPPRRSRDERRLEELEDYFASADSGLVAPRGGIETLAVKAGIDSSLSGTPVKPGGGSSLNGTPVKPGGGSPLGGCDFPSIKNYPRTSRAPVMPNARPTLKAIEEAEAGEAGVEEDVPAESKSSDTKS